ncbi:hypothetical protein GCM10007973_25020 [Polymorphobacter multimanifer]|uniref:DUF1449 family protein n=1 Tax=Polymorphobacter multimanifer TaxID=1070431 RepID=A0A841L3M3_9SPHN|nr:OB-fold-containig protein [Polymorphobacter multimanifer]MBB6226886.1 hypothetical protein [Polymorphobacter multimanifer]GGI87547.1 hypothetical protein GCM10007973_25020 [Polymorphobacter multimanifer]
MVVIVSALGVLMLDFLLDGDVVAFSLALVAMIAVGAVQAIGLDADADADAMGGGLDWLNAGRLPLLMLLVVFLAVFGMVGLALQQAALALADGVLPWVAAVPAAAVLALPGTRLAGRLLAPILPRDETTAVALESLVGRRARIVVGVARPGSPARARVTDAHGQAHFVMVEPAAAGEHDERAELLLVAREGDVFRVVEVDPDPFGEARNG